MHIAVRIVLFAGLALGPCFSSSQERIPQSPQTTHQTLSDPALQKLADDYFADYSHKDLKGMMALWSARSAGRDAHRKQLHDWFVSTSTLVVSDLSVNYLEIDATRAKLTLRMRVKASNEPSPDSRKMIRTLTCVREANIWKIWSDADEFENLATALLNAKGETERSQLLRSNSELVSPELVVAFVRSIRALENKGAFDQALVASALAKGIAESIHDQIGVGLVLLEFGFVQQIQGKYDDALDSYQKVTAIADASGNQWLSATAMGSTGTVLRRQGKLREALDYTLRCLPIFESLGDKEKVSYRLSDVGMTYLRLGDYESASKYLQQSLALFEQRDDRSGIGFVTQNLGILYVMRSDNLRALLYFKKALALDEEMGNRDAVALLLGNIGNVYQTQNEYAQAIAYYNRSLTLTRQIGDPLGEASALQNIGGVYLRMHNWEAALQSARESQAIFERAGVKEGTADCLASIGNILQRRHQYAQAREQFLKSLAINEEIGEQERIGESLGELANIDNRLENPTRALESSTRACSIAHQMNDRGNIMSCRISMGESYGLLHQTDQARQAFDEAITAIESMRRDVAGGAQQEQTFFEAGNATPYQDMVELLVDEKQFPVAFTYAERGKARALLDVLRSGHDKIDKVMSLPDRETEQKLEIQLVSLNAQMERESSDSKLADLTSQRDKLRLQLDDFETQLYSRYPELTVQRGRAPLITVDEASVLPFDDKTAILEFMVGAGETVLLVLTRETPTARSLTVSAYPIDVDAEVLGKESREFRDQMAGRQLGFQSSARHLYDLLLQPAAAQLKDKTALIIVPDGVLWNLPFQSLLDPTRHYLLEKYAIAYVPSLTVMREMIRTRHPASTPQNTEPRLLAMANPVLAKEPAESAGAAGRGNSLAPLPNAEAEIRALARLYGPEHSHVYIGDQATETRFKSEAGGFNVLHLATHGFLSDSSPMYSSILLARSATSEDDGLLEAREIMNLDLQADLVVLSACETARGQIGDGEGIIGLTWAFFAAGVPTTVASQWKVDSESTTELMLAFHRGLRQEHGSAFATARSLQGAALKLLHTPQYAHPFYWAGFVVVGNPN
jgi:CHAT domain-containing protein/Tfp pilus assembly protein PilF